MQHQARLDELLDILVWLLALLVSLTVVQKRTLVPLQRQLQDLRGTFPRLASALFETTLDMPTEGIECSVGLGKVSCTLLRNTVGRCPEG